MSSEIEQATNAADKLYPPPQPSISEDGERQGNLEEVGMEQNQLSPVPSGTEKKSLFESLLPPAVGSIFGDAAQSTICSQASVSRPECELKINVLSPQSGLAEVVLSHNALWGEVHKHTFPLGDAKKRKQFTKTCVEALEAKLTEEELEKLWNKVERELLDSYQQLEKQERWREQQRKITPAERLHETDRKAGKSLLKNPSLLYSVGRTLEALGLAGETVNGLLLYLAMTSRLMDKILSVAVKSESSSGKSFLTETVLKLFPREVYILVSGLSPKVLYYDNEDYKHRMLVVAEAAGMGDDAEYTLRTLLSENRLRLKTVDKDAKGRNQVRELTTEGPTGLILTTTKARMNLENETRYLSMGLDESQEQSQRIKDATAQRWQRVGKQVERDKWIAAQCLLEPVEVEIPFGAFLAERTPEKPLRIRRDFEKLLILIAASAALHQRQRKNNGTKEDGTKIITASVVDYFIAKELFEPAFFQSVQGIHPNTRKVMEAIKKLYRKKTDEAQPDPDTGFKYDVTVNTQELADELKVSKTTVLKWAQPLEPYGWIIEGGEGKANEYRKGIEPDPKKSVLPSVGDLISQYPQLVPAEGIEAIHPLTGEKVTLAEGQGSGNQASPTAELPKDAVVCTF